VCSRISSVPANQLQLAAAHQHQLVNQLHRYHPSSVELASSAPVSHHSSVGARVNFINFALASPDLAHWTRLASGITHRCSDPRSSAVFNSSRVDSDPSFNTSNFTPASERQLPRAVEPLLASVSILTHRAHVSAVSDTLQAPSPCAKFCRDLWT